MKNKGPGSRYYLRRRGEDLFGYLDEKDFIQTNVVKLATALDSLLKNELDSPTKCQSFWQGIKPALAGCPKLDHFDKYENILAYGFVHMLDRYLRVWEVLMWLVRAAILPVPRKLNVLDIGSGPASALYAVSDFYLGLRDFANDMEVSRLLIEDPDLYPIELSVGMRHFFHILSEVSNRRGPFDALVADFSGFDPVSFRDEDLRKALVYYEPEEGFVTDRITGDDKMWANDLHRYQLVIFSNFLTAPELVARFRQQVVAAFQQQRPGGVVVVLGGVEEPYPKIYTEVETIAGEVGHYRVPGIPTLIDDTSRRPYFPIIKELNNSLWLHLQQVGQNVEFTRTGYPPYWDEAAPIKSLKSFALHVYRKGKLNSLGSSTT